jgi:hypothetical protein
LEQEKATKALKKAEEDLEEAKKQNKGEKIIANKSSVVSAAKERRDKANLTVSGFDISSIQQQKSA